MEVTGGCGGNRQGPEERDSPAWSLRPSRYEDNTASRGRRKLGLVDGRLAYRSRRARTKTSNGYWGSAFWSRHTSRSSKAMVTMRAFTFCLGSFSSCSAVMPANVLGVVSDVDERLYSVLNSARVTSMG